LAAFEERGTGEVVIDTRLVTFIHFIYFIEYYNNPTKHEIKIKSILSWNISEK